MRKDTDVMPHTRAGFDSGTPPVQTEPSRSNRRYHVEHVGADSLRLRLKHSHFPSVFDAKYLEKFARKYLQKCHQPCARLRRHVCLLLNPNLYPNLNLDLNLNLNLFLFLKLSQ
jgi:hypothetical protein